MVYVRLKFLAQPVNLDVLSFTLNLNTPLVRLYTGIFVVGIPLPGQIQIGVNLAATLTNVKNYIDTTYGAPEVNTRIAGNDILIEPIADVFALSSFADIPSVLSITEESTDMNIIKVRSPFIVNVAEVGQDGSKIELFIWNKGTTEPTTPTYTLSKSIPSATQIDNIYNISNYIREYITPVKPTLVTTPTVEENNAWAICKVKRYKLVGSTYTLLNTIEYVCVDGFTTYNEGRQIAITPTIGNSPALALSNPNIIVNYNNNSYLNVICKKNDGFDLTAKYYTQSGILIQTQTILTSGVDNEYFNYKVPLRYSLGTLDYQKLILSYEDIFFEKAHIKIEECKYTPVSCSFINRYGGWEFLTFFKQQSNSISVKGTNYKLMPSSVNYNVSIGQSKTFNINGTQTIKLNTGFVNENYSELITDLLLSEIVLLDDKPVNVKTQGSDLKTHLKDRMINYEIEFEYAYNLINDVV